MENETKQNETIKFNDINFKKEYSIELFKNYLKELLTNKYKVYINNDNNNISYAYIVKNNNIAYIQLSNFFGLSFSSSYKPSKNNGTGARMFNEITKPTLNHIDRTFNHSFGKVEFWKDWEEFQKKAYFKYLEVIL
jgi:hypothetical protein